MALSLLGVTSPSVIYLKMTKSWPNVIIHEFIDKLYPYKLLWDLSDKNYKLINKKNAVWNIILSEMIEQFSATHPSFTENLRISK